MASPQATVDPSYEYPHINVARESKSVKMWVAISLSLTFTLALALIIYCLIKMRQQRQRQQQQLEIHFVEMTAALPRRIYHAAGDTDEDRLDCSICLDEYEDEEELVELPGCGHLFHAHCIEDALRLQRECPNCRALVAA